MSPYQNSGATIPKMLGRKKLLTRVIAMLGKRNADNLSIVGPKLYGKTVFLHHLSEYIKTGTGGYLTSVFVDLRHGTPQNDAEFRRMLADQIQAALHPIRDDWAAALRSTDECTVSDITDLVLQELENEGKRILIIFDGFDHLTLGNGISPNLLDQLRFFAQRSSLRYVIGSRKRLRELCKTEESKTSDFWRIFAEPVQIGSFDEEDIQDFWTPFEKRSIEIEPGAKTEFKNQTGGIPVFVAGMLKKLYESASEGQKITQRQIVELTKDFCRESQDAIVDIWEDCSLELRNLVVNACTGEASTNAYPNPLIEQALFRGFLKKEGNHLKSLSRVMEEFAFSQSSIVQDMNRLFANKTDFEKNIKGVLELRLSQVNNISNELIDYVKHSIRDMDDGPKLVLDNARGIVEEACKFITKTEGIEIDGRLPTEWIERWRSTNVYGPPEDIDPFPSDRGKQIRALSFICGCDGRYIKLSKKISRQTFTLLRNINEIGNFSNHSLGEKVLAGTAIVLCITAIELIESMSRDCEIN